MIIDSNYLPRSFDIKRYIDLIPEYEKNKLLDFKLCKDKLLYIITLVKINPIIRERWYNQNEWVILFSKYLKQIFGNYYKTYIDFWIHHKIIIENPAYMPSVLSEDGDGKSKGYKFLDMKYLLDPTIKVDISNSVFKRTLVRLHNKKQIEIKKSLKGYGFLKKWFNNKLVLDYPDDESVCDFQREWENRINRNEYNLSVDSFGNRFHSSLTNLKSTLRPHLTFDGQKLVEMDIGGSQPYFSITVIMDYIRKEYPEKYQRIIGFQDEEEKIDYIKTVNEFHGLGEYITAIQRDLYEYLGGFYELKYGHKPSNRNDLKEILFQILYSKNQFSSEGKSLFTELFPFPASVFNEVKKKDHKNLSRILQRIESDTILRTICEKISEENNNVPLYTIHDSILTTPNHFEFVHMKMNEILTENVGFRPKIKVTRF